ncbi:MAG: InlB B-repeat-containing protein [Treponema sp.]|nr:InlB B-repeat-containing protein [Treponema sp.]
MKKKLCAGAAAFLLPFILACQMPGPENGAGPEGKAAVRVVIEGAAGGQSRTARPAVALSDVNTWKLSGSKAGGSETELGEVSPGGTVYLETGQWNFTLTGHKGSPAVPILQGALLNQTISAGANLSFTVSPVTTGAGTVKLTVNLPAGHGIATAKVLQDGAVVATVTPAAGANTVVYEATHAAGDYYFSVRLHKGDDACYGAVSDLVQVRGNLTSEKTYDLELADLNLIYLINYDLNGGAFNGGVAPPGSYRSTDAAFALPIPVWQNYVFDGWYDSSGQKATMISQGSVGNKAFSARWITPSGNLDYAIDLPAGVRAWFGFYPVDVLAFAGDIFGDPNNANDDKLEIDISSGTAGTASDFIAGLPVGTYRAVIEAYNGADNKALSWIDTVTIIGGNIVTLNKTFTGDDFTECAPVATGSTLAAKLDAALSASGNSTIVLDGSEADLGSFTGKTLSGSKTIAIRGNGRTVQLQTTTTGSPLLTVSTGLNLALHDVTLRGATNKRPLVSVNSSTGTLEMKAGSRVTGHTNNNNESTYAGSVNIREGAFAMSGGEVIDNVVASMDGGGVYVNIGGTFTMSGGAISRNTASGGGGVCLFNSGSSFTMSGGAISRNSARSRGGGVITWTNAPFTMSGGAISHNSAGYNCGGVCAQGPFTMSGGLVGDNVVVGSSAQYVYGKEVVVISSGTFTMSAAARPERVLLSKNTNFITVAGPLSGGTVFVDLGISDDQTLADWVGKQILDSADEKAHFTLGNVELFNSASAGYTATPIPAGYTIGNDGALQAAGN